MSTVECVVAGKNRLGETPIWSVEEQALYWVDAREPAVYRLDPSSGQVTSVKLPVVVGCIGFRKSGGLIAGLQNGFHTLDFATGALSLIFDPEADQPENRINDGRADRRGRFWAGTMNDVRRDPTGSLYRLDADHRCTKLRDDVIVPNALAWSPDDKTMYFADTYRFHILQYDFSADDGVISNERLFADCTASKPGRPDGATIDADGCLWNAEYGGGRIVRYTPAGKIDRVIPMPVSQTSSCAFGGPKLDTLYVTSASQRLTPEQLAAEPLAGNLFAIHVGVSGLPEPAYAG